jgi:5-methylthioadenosine/S-adenosylhomocysteine deaminase
VHTVVVNGRVLKYDGTRIDLDIAPARDAVAKSVEYVRSQIGEKAWEEGMHPVLEPEAEIENPYKYTKGTAHVRAQS